MDGGNALHPPSTRPEGGDGGTQLPAQVLPPPNHQGLSSEDFFFFFYHGQTKWKMNSFR